MRGKVPPRVRLLAALTPQPDWDSITPDQVIELREAQKRKHRSALVRLATGKLDRGARITTYALDLPGRRLNVRVYQPERGGSALPLIIAFHGGGFIGGTPEQSDNLAGIAPALIQAAGLDPLADQAPAYADCLRKAGVDVTLTRYPEAVHSFLSMPGLVPAARPARAEILAHLRGHLLEQRSATRSTKTGQQ